MLKTLTFTVAAGLMAALFTINANALPVTPAQQMTAESNVTLVRDDCGRGRHFSRSRGHCVDDFERRREIREDCGRGWHFSNSRGRCVRNDGFRADNDDAAAAAVFGAILGGAARANRDHDRRDNNRHRD